MTVRHALDGDNNMHDGCNNPKTHRRGLKAKPGCKSDQTAPLPNRSLISMKVSVEWKSSGKGGGWTEAMDNNLPVTKNQGCSLSTVPFIARHSERGRVLAFASALCPLPSALGPRPAHLPAARCPLPLHSLPLHSLPLPLPLPLSLPLPLPSPLPLPLPSLPLCALAPSLR